MLSSRPLNFLQRVAAAASTRALATTLRTSSGVAASVLIVTSNRASHLHFTLAALQKQNFPAQTWEVIVADDASCDDTLEVLREYLQRGRLPLIVHRMDEPLGAVRARNTVLEAARGNIIIFLGDAQLVDPDFLMRHLLHHARGEEPCVIIGASRRNVHTHLFASTDPTPMGVPLTPLFIPEELLSQLNDAQCLPMLLSEDAPNMGAMFDASSGKAQHPLSWAAFNLNNASVPRERGLAVGGFDESFRDWGLAEEDLALRLHKSGMPFHYEPHAVSLGQLHPSQPVSGIDIGCNLHRFFCKHPELDRAQIELMLLSKHFA